MYIKETNAAYMTREFKAYCRSQLIKMFGEENEKGRKEIISYSLVNDSDYPSIHEKITFKFRGATYSATLWHGEYAKFEKVGV